MDFALIIFSSQKKEKSNKYLNFILFLIIIYVAYKDDYYNYIKNIYNRIKSYDIFKKNKLFS